MVKVIKGSKTFDIASNELVSIQPAYDGIVLRCSDQTEIKFNMEVSQQVQAVLAVADKNLDKDLVLDFNQVNNPSKLLQIGKK